MACVENDSIYTAYWGNRLKQITATDPRAWRSPA